MISSVHSTGTMYRRIMHNLFVRSGLACPRRDIFVGERSVSACNHQLLSTLRLIMLNIIPYIHKFHQLALIFSRDLAIKFMDNRSGRGHYGFTGLQAKDHSAIGAYTNHISAIAQEIRYIRYIYS